jgi:methyltransferase family protein
VPGRVRRAAAALGLHVARRRDYHLVRRSFYSPIPDEATLPPGVRHRRSELRGIEFDTSAQAAWAVSELARYTHEMEAPEDDPGDGRFYFANGVYQHGDAELAYAMVRHFKPERVIELGSGFSTLVLAEALQANARDGSPGRLESNDPHGELRDVRRRPAESIPVAEFEELREGDVLFVDTTHVVRLGGDVNHIVLDVLPALAPGVVVHFHDIWLPFEYHEALTRYHGVHWSEQYLLQAFLSGNPDWEVLFATRAICVDQPDAFAELVPTYEGYPTSFWLRRRAA